VRLLLDTHVIIWLMEDDSRLNAEARKLIASTQDVFASSASIWEIAIKTRLGKLRIDGERLILRLAQAGIGELHVTNSHAVATGRLPLLHRDPFDRLLVAQAISETMRLLTSDAQLVAYSELVTVV
jgi:PIN domain nuclease of toxin-antitoxin system